MNGVGRVCYFLQGMDSGWLSERMIYVVSADVGIVLFDVDTSEDYILFSLKVLDAHP